MEQATKVNSEWTHFLELPPSCIEFCPAHPSYFVVGTYNLQKEEADAARDGAAQGEQPTNQPQTRTGSLVVFRLEGSTARHVQTLIHPSAILDLHFHPHRPDILAVVNSTGTLSLLQLAPPTSGGGNLLTELAVNSPLPGAGGIIFTSCCWHPKSDNSIAITTSTNEVHLFELDGSWHTTEAEDSTIHNHDDYAWTVAFSPDDTCPAVLSGGDDSRLLFTNTDDGSTEVLKGHQSGVTALLPLQHRPGSPDYILLTGSYDEHIRVYSMAGLPMLLAKANLGGGVWRLKQISFTIDGDRWVAVILASCMHAGARILRLSGDDEGCKIDILARFEEHTSMNYGSDFHPVDGDRQDLVCVSTSFYDKRMCIWKFAVE
ncbi:hypothetical protein JX265_008886 [Neoarthrinium moseri]|uniref:methylated diphthine methylhydrolase n=1 Tax=Neoarthrinium moseri TaxID=1658444 RepID=A0A9P9WHL6_9PEZI|nr:hypothetical protein JX265_008886 [Neoarthrinium moseri]